MCRSRLPKVGAIRDGHYAFHGKLQYLFAVDCCPEPAAATATLCGQRSSRLRCGAQLSSSGCEPGTMVFEYPRLRRDPRIVKHRLCKREVRSVVDSTRWSARDVRFLVHRNRQSVRRTRLSKREISASMCRARPVVGEVRGLRVQPTGLVECYAKRRLTEGDRNGRHPAKDLARHSTTRSRRVFAVSSRRSKAISEVDAIPLWWETTMCT
ncbi:hypothetical protein LMG18090_00798 [Ralstonia mannitolilytica]|nr:hypothetical protein LMG18090_00798 [Ralstonia mannitolilytica]CAJ0895311.1 hypothetical protein R6138_03884 [Ralstonia sp. LMG 18095]